MVNRSSRAEADFVAVRSDEPECVPGADPVLVVGRDAAIIDFVAHAARRSERRIAVLAPTEVLARIHENVACLPIETFPGAVAQPGTGGAGCPPYATIIVFLASDRTLPELVARIAREQQPACVVLVSSFLAHFGDAEMRAVEDAFRKTLAGAARRLVVLRAGHLLCDHSRLGHLVRRVPFVFSLLPTGLKSCFVTGDELFATIERAAQKSSDRKERTYTLLGANRPWNSIAPARTFAGRFVFSVLRVLGQLLLLGPILALVIRLLGKKRPGLKALNVDTLRPRSLKELLELYNPFNHSHVKIVGYNNGVVHFGHAYPGRTIVSTVRCDKLARVRGHIAQFDCGVTIRRAMDVLAADRKELYVLPNYSYVSLATAFFVPIHGSSSTFSTVGETITKVILYDPLEDRAFSAKADEPDFGKYLYNLSADVLVLRVEIQVKDKSRYFVKKQGATNASGAEVWDCFHDRTASNVEVRKAGAATQQIQVYRYYTEVADGAGSETLEVPRDRLGRLWDQLEENPISSVLFHGLSRRLAHHVELFMSEEEFKAFWETHGALPIAKIQLRYIKKDGFPHSPFRDHDCISADLFMLKKHRRSFEEYLKKTLPQVKLNPGKHSM
jgi:hypothetical protein